jgi:hypothetical protein
MCLVFVHRNIDQHEEEYINVGNSYDKKQVKVWQKFKRIEEFDPVDFI